MADYTFYVKVANSKFVLDSVSQATIALGHGITYRFDQSDSSNSGHPLVFSTTSDGTHNSGSAYTTGVTTTGTAGSSGAYVDIAVTSSTPASLYYYCSNHSGMGSAVITTGNTHVTTNNLGLLLPILADATDQWGSHINQSLRKIEDTFGANADVYTYNITGDTTAITGSATAGGTLAFNDGQHIEVYLNGVKLVGNLSSGNDYTLNASTDTITLASNAINGDVVNIVVFKTFQFADAVPATGGTFSGNVSFGDNNKAQFGAGSDLQIYHDGSDSIIKDGGTGDLIIGGDNDVTIADSSLTEAKAKFTTNGAVNLYYDNSNKFQTTATGINVSGNVVIADGGNIGSASDTDAITIDSSGNIGIGNTSPEADLHIGEYQSGSGQTATLRLSEGNGAGDSTGFDIKYVGSSDNLIFNSKDGSGNFADRMTINRDTGNVTVNSGNVIIGTAGKGIDFSSATDHTTGESSVGSVLDDYEEGTWTPTLSNSGSATVTYAKYRKVGNMATVWARLGDLNCPSYSATTLTIGTPVATLTNEEYCAGSFIGNGIDLSSKLTISTYVYNNNFYFYYTTDSLNSWGFINWGHFYTNGASDIFFCATYPCQ